MKATLSTPPEDIPAFAPPSELVQAASPTSETDIPGVEGSDQGQIKVEEEDVRIPPLAPSTQNESASGTKPDAEEVVVEEEEEEDTALSPRADHPDITGAKPSGTHDGQSEEDLEEVVAPVTEGIEVNDEIEAARRQRVAEKLANMGGINPFALPPQRKPSIPTEAGLSRDSRPASISQGAVTSPPLPLQHDKVDPVVVESVEPKKVSQDGNY